MDFSIFNRLAFATALFASFASANAQDLLAKQAPIDRKQKAVDSLAITKLTVKESFENPATDLYTTWNTKSVHCYSNSDIPETYRIDLRGFAMPTTSRKVTSNYGYRASFRRMHKGIDIKVYVGDTINAAFDGKVRMVSYEGRGYGKFVVIRHNNGLETVYGHMSKQLVTEGQIVKAGQPMGLGGNTGRSTGSHLHFETRLVGQAIDPALLFDFANQDIKCDYYVFHRSGKGRAGTKTMASNTTVKPATTADEEPDVVPAKNMKVEEALTGKYHKVAPGETVASIARKLDISVDLLCNANHISRSTRVRPGQILRY